MPDPRTFGAGVKVSVPAASTAGSAAKNSGVSTMMEMLNCSADSFGGPGEQLVNQLGTLCGPLSSVVAGNGWIVQVGGSFTGETPILNVCEVLVSTPPFAVP